VSTLLPVVYTIRSRMPWLVNLGVFTLFTEVETIKTAETAYAATVAL